VVKKLTAEDIASIIHEANRQHRLVMGQAPGPHWGETRAEVRASATNGVVKALEGYTPEELHQEWVEFKGAQGWTWGPYKDRVNRRHPCMVPYEDLPEHEQVKDHMFIAMVNALRGRM
jgi:hypothetical protein